MGARQKIKVRDVNRQIKQDEVEFSRWSSGQAPITKNNRRN
jgi:hypothetical protein